MISIASEPERPRRAEGSPRGTGRPGCPRRTRRGRAGLALVDVTWALTVLVIAIGGLSASLVSSLQLSRTAEESSLAAAAANAMAERLQSVPFESVFSAFNEVDGDDPTGLILPLGSSFDVPGLNARPDDPDGSVGRIRFPAVTLPGGVSQLREDVEDGFLGMPRDLNADGGTDDQDHSGDYVLLPVRIELEWRGVRGDRSLELGLLLVR